MIRPARRVVQATFAIVIAAAFLTPPSIARAQTSRFEQIESYAGPARQQRLVEAAKREGEITLYSALTTDDNAALIEGFERRCGLKVKLWRASSEMLLRRVVNEAGARRFEFDAILSSASGLEPLHREQLLQEIRSPVLANLI